MVKLGADLAPFLVDGVGEGFVIGHALLGIERGAKAMGKHRHISQNDHGAAAGGDVPQPLYLLRLGKPQRSRSENDPVF